MTPNRPENLTDAEKAAWLEGPEGRRLLREAELRPVRFVRQERAPALAEWLASLDDVDRRIVDLVSQGAACNEVATRLGEAMSAEQVRARLGAIREHLDAFSHGHSMGPDERDMMDLLAARCVA
jgi:hypothetical protein